ncbi:MAG: ABC transporter ATP-binding protein [Candidatus Leucobacter sulfamidivorax]|nr:ABC transporter ATP-binding protein [Candidatus Leucobacter sulfamidivorax]
MLEIAGLRKVYTGRRGSFEAIADLALTVAPGEFISVVGPSGAGKTTLLRCIAGLMPITAGTLKLEGRQVDGPPADMAVVLQEYGRSLFPWMTVAQNVELPLKEKKVPKALRRQKVEEAIEAVGLAGSADKHPWELSGGMQQRVAIARAVAYEPKLLMMDEPFAAVDAQTRAELEDLVLRLWRQLGFTVLFVTHDIDESVYLSQRVVVLTTSPTQVLDDIPIELTGPRSQLKTRATPEFAALRTRVYETVQAAKMGARSLPYDGPLTATVPVV